MSDEISLKRESKPKKKCSWEKSESVNGITKRVSVREVENGFVISVSKYGHSEKEDKYIDHSCEYISTKNPLEKLKPKEEEIISGDKAILKSIENMFNESDY